MKQKESYVLAMNGGSSSIKFALYRMSDSPKRQLSGKVDRIGLSGTTLTFDDQERNQQDSLIVGEFDHRSAANFLIDWLDKKITLTTQASDKYPGDGAFTLVNGVQNEKGFAKSKEFLGFSGTDCEAIIDFGKEETVNSVKIHVLDQQSSWIYPPTMEVYSSTDGINFTEAPNAEGRKVVALYVGCEESQLIVLRLTTPSEFFPPNKAAVISRLAFCWGVKVLKNPTHWPSVNSYFMR